MTVTPRRTSTANTPPASPRCCRARSSTMRWGVPEGTRDEDGDLIHDDIVLADALLAEADALPWTVTARR